MGNIFSLHQNDVLFRIFVSLSFTAFICFTCAFGRAKHALYTCLFRKKLKWGRACVWKLLNQKLNIFLGTYLNVKMEKSAATQLDKYLEDPVALQNSYNDFCQFVREGGFLVSLANMLANWQQQSIKLRKVYFHGKFKSISNLVFWQN